MADGGGGDAGPTVVYWLVEALTAALTAVIGFMAVRLHNRVDALETRNLENAVVLVTREELQGYIGQATDDRRSMHAENKEELQESRKLLVKIFERLDAVTAMQEKMRRAELDIAKNSERIERLAHRPGPPER